MRQIKFRGKCIEKREWVYGYLSFIYVDGRNSKGFIYTDRAQIYSQDDAISYNVHTKSVGQFTGLLDKNGKSIYEGDIMQFKWDNEANIFEKDMRFEVKCHSLGNIEPYNMIEGAVIGNIYENPELISTPASHT